MSLQTRDFVDVAVRSHHLGCRVPVRVALLPGNFDTAANAGEFCFHAATPHVRSAWQSVGLEDEGPSGAAPNPQLLAPSETGSQLLTPFRSADVPLAVFLGAALLIGPEWCLTVSLSMISRVLALAPCCSSSRDVRLDVVVERPGERGCECIEYKGDAFGIIALGREVRRIWIDG